MAAGRGQQSGKRSKTWTMWSSTKSLTRRRGFRNTVSEFTSLPSTEECLATTLRSSSRTAENTQGEDILRRTRQQILRTSLELSGRICRRSIKKLAMVSGWDSEPEWGQPDSECPLLQGWLRNSRMLARRVHGVRPRNAPGSWASMIHSRLSSRIPQAPQAVRQRGRSQVATVVVQEILKVIRWQLVESRMRNIC